MIKKYSCLGATQYYFKLSVLINDSDTSFLMIKAHNYSVKLLGKDIKYNASSYSGLNQSNCGYDIHTGDKYFWLNDGIVTAKPSTKKE
jgi:hypothetical protein